MKLVRLAIRRLPGIHEPFELGEEDLRGTLHVVHGPNGSGKSSLVRAVRAVLWPETPRAETVEVEARFVSGATSWVVLRDGSKVSWQRDGQDADPPELPSADLAKAFLISIDDLSRLDTHDFTEEIRRQMSGGVDFSLLAAEAAWTERSTIEPRKALEKAEREARLAQEELGRLAADQERLAELEAEQAEAKRNSAELAHLEASLELCAKRARSSRLSARLEGFPPGMDRLRGDELDRLEEIGERVERAERGIADLDAEIARHREAALRCGLAAPMDERAELELTSRLERWRQAERELENARALVAGARERRRIELERCRGARPEALLETSGSALPDLDSLSRDAAALEGERSSLRSELERLPRAKADLDPQRINAALAALRSWLNAPDGAEPSSRWPAFVLAVLAALAFAVIALSVHPAGWAGVVVAALIALLASTRRRATSPSREAYASQYEALGLGTLRQERAAVEARFLELEAELRWSAEQRAAQERRLALERALEKLAERELELDRRRRQVRAGLGVDGDLADLDLTLFARSVGDFRRADAELSKARAELEDREKKRDDTSAALRAALTRHGLEDVADLEAASAAVESLKARSNRLAKAREDERRALEERSRAAKQLEAARGDSARFWALASIPGADEAELRARVERLDPWRKEHGELELVRREIVELEAKLGTGAAEADLGAEVLQRRRDEARAKVERLVPLTEEIARIRSELDGARRRFGLEAANAERARCRAELEGVLEDARAKALRAFLLDEIRRDYEREAQPEVLKRAEETFKRCTHGRYGLIGTPDGTLRALDTERGGFAMPLDQLSTGTRAQLLIAVRLAFAARAASGETLPVFLDDALATSDPSRIRAVGDLLRESAREEGRQFLYLTTEPGDARLIAGDEPGRVGEIDLAALRRMQRPAESSARLALPETPSVPPPGSHTPEQYAELLRVPPIDPYAGIGALHVFYVLRDDPADLHRVLEHHVERVGPLRIALGGGARLLEGEALARLEAWIAVASSVLETWRIGRGKPAGREILAHEESGVTDTFLDKITELAGELGGDAKRLIDALERNEHPNAARFRQSSREKLRDLLEREGYLDPRATLEREEAWLRLLQILPSTGWTPPPAELRARFEWLWSLLVLS